MEALLMKMRIAVVPLWVPGVETKVALLAKRGHEVRQARDIEEAERLVGRDGYDLLIADLRACFGYGSTSLHKATVDGNAHALIMCPSGTRDAARMFRELVTPYENARIRYHGCGASRDIQRFRWRITEIEIERFRMAH